MYASQDNLYLLQTSDGWWFRPERQRQQTAIYKIAIGDGAPEPRAYGRVDGWVQSSFQLSEHDGFLRVVTNRNEVEPTDDRVLQDNNLYVLQDNNARRLREVGSVLGFGKNERIFSARLLGERGYVVTFRQIDPLFTFDLSNPRDPRLAGEVEIKGVSTYIHPLDDAHLLTIGFDGDENRLNGDFRLQIFDVRNLEDPRLIHSLVPLFDAPGHAWTPATYDHLAFNYFRAGGHADGAGAVLVQRRGPALQRLHGFLREHRRRLRRYSAGWITATWPGTGSARIRARDSGHLRVGRVSRVSQPAAHRVGPVAGDDLHVHVVERRHEGQPCSRLR